MAQVTIGKAAAGDDPALRQTLREMPMPGLVQLAYLREPSFFQALCVEGRRSDVIICRDTETGACVGQGTRSVKPCFVNGQVADVGYLASLRIKTTHRGVMFFRAYKVMQRAHQDDGRVRLYLSTILESNAPALKLLSSGRGGLPRYRDLGRFRAMALGTRPRVRKVRGDVAVRPATPSELPALLAFLHAEGPARQFFPAYEAEDFSGGLLRGLGITDVLLALEGGAIVGCLGLWEQKAFRQSLVTGYDPRLLAVRPAVSALCRLLGYPPLPPVGQTLDYCYLALPTARGGDRSIFAALLAAAFEHGRERYPFFMAGLHERDPLLPVLAARRHLSYASRLFAVHWDDGTEAFAALDQRPPYLEIGGL